MSKAIEQSIKEKIKKRARSSDRLFNDIWQEVVLERWLVRLSKSNYRDNFIFKGAMCLSQYISLGRQTFDLDFLVRNLRNSQEQVSSILAEISRSKLVIWLPSIHST